MDQPAFKQVLVIYNPSSTGNGERLAHRYARRLQKTGLQTVVKPTDKAGHAEDLVLEAAKKNSPLMVVMASGDGGYNEVINGAMTAQEMGYSVVTGLLPAGNANDHFKALHRPYALKRIKANDAKKIDLLKLSGTVKGQPWQRYAHSYIGFGLTSEIVQALNEAKLNPANEIIISVKAFMKFEPFEAKVAGQKRVYQSIIIGNIKKMSKFLLLSRQSKVDDGLFEVYTIESTRAGMIGTLAKAATVGAPHEAQVKSYNFETVDPLPVQLDGEVFTLDANSKVQITIARQALECIV